MAYRISLTPLVFFGAGSSSQAGEKVKELGCEKVICITDKGVKESGIADKIVKYLREAGIKVILYDRTLPDPPDYIIEECAKIAKDEQVDGVVGVGGGSSLDTAKGVNVLLGNPLPITSYLDRSKKRLPGKTLVLIPTTAGTGSEVTSVSVITNTKINKKGGVSGTGCISTLSLVDPELTVGLPASVTAATGMDAFSHVAESLTSKLANPFADILAERAIMIIKRYLPLAVREGSNMTARTNMSLAAMLGGMTLKDAPTHIGHSIAHVLGSKLHISHGVGCAIALPEVIEYVADAVPEKVKLIGKAMGLDVDSLSAREMGREVPEAIRRLNKDVGIPTLRELKVEKASLEAIAAEVLDDDCAPFVPKETTAEKILELLHNAYKQ